MPKDLSKTLFYSRSNYPPKNPQGEFSKYEPIYSLKIKDGVEELVEVGKTNVYEKIQAYAESTYIYNILDRFAGGDVEALDVRRGFYADVTQLPKTRVEMLQSMIDSERYFNSLPLEIRQAYDHSLIKFLEAYDNGSFQKRFKEEVVPPPSAPAASSGEDKK